MTTTTAIITSPDGVTWTPVTTPVTSGGLQVVWDDVNDLFIATAADASAANNVFTSPDGITWTEQIHNLGWLPVIGTGNGRTLVHDNTNQLWYSDDGVTWTSTTTTTGVHGLAFIKWIASQFLAFTFGTPTHVTSPDGINWTVRAAGDFSIFGLASNGSYAISIGEASTWAGLNLFGTDVRDVESSPDGITWTRHNSSFDNGITWCAAWNGTDWIVAGQSHYTGTADTAALVATTPDLTTWTVHSSPFDGPAGTAIVAGWSSTLGWLLAGTLNSTGHEGLATSPDAVTWTVQNTGITPTSQIRDVAWSPTANIWVAVGSLTVNPVVHGGWSVGRLRIA